MAIGVLIKRCSLIAGDTLLAEARNLTIARMQNVWRVLPNRDREGVGACADCSSPAIFFARNIGLKRKAPRALSAKRMAVARPLPIVSPGVWPAPITMATLSLSLIRKPFKPLFQLDSATVQRHRYQRVLPGCENQIQELLGVVAPGQRLPSRITDKRVRVQLVNSPQQCGFERVPSGGVRPHRNPPNIFRAEAHLLSDGDMMPPFILRPAQPSHAEDHHLPLSRGK